LGQIIDRLADGDLDTCLFHKSRTDTSPTIALCPTGEGQPDDIGGWETEPDITDRPAPPEEESGSEEETGSEAGARILILALDAGEPRYNGQSGAQDYAALLEDQYDVTVWSVAEDGLPRTSDALAYDLVIWTAGDFEQAMGEDESDLLLTLMLDGEPTVLSGAYVSDTEREAVQRDVQVMDTQHALTRGFEAGQVIVFETEQDYVVNVLDGFGEGTETIVMARGPASEESGAASVVVIDDELTGMRVAIVGFPIYLLPDEARATFVRDIASWALTP
jgi:hypothetical protein